MTSPTAPLRRPPTRALVVVVAAIALAVIVGFGLAYLNSDKPSDPGGDDGSSQLGAAPGGVTTADATGTGSPGTTGSPSPGVSPSPGPARGADLRASYKVSKGLLGVNTTVEVTITNQGTADSTPWTVAIRLSTVATLNVQPGPGVNHASRDGQEIFTPTGEGAELPPGSVLTFTFEVKGVDVNVASCMIEQRACTAA